MSNKIKITGEKKYEINPDMIGLFFEDINFAADGGLYAEMLENRSFEAVKTEGSSRDYVLSEDSLYAWSVINGGGAKASINMPLCEKNPHYLRFTAKEAGAGFCNKAYDGLCLKKGMKYNISFYAREIDYLKGDIAVRLVKDGKSYGETVVKFVVAQTEEPDDYSIMVGNVEAKIWRKYETVIEANEDVKGALFEVSLTEKGCIEFDLFSMIPEDAVEGVFRPDLLKALADLHPGFLRFPGGCIVEGTSIMRRYRWKDTVGPIEQRKINTNLWAATGGNTTFAYEMPDSHYMQSYGIGFYEYFRLCELLSTKDRICKAVPVLNIGVACQFRSYETVKIDTEEFDEYVKDALDLIEFANGPADSKWGALRASMGHPESFNLTMIAIGNEQWDSKQVDMSERYLRFEKAIHDRYPEIKCLGTAGPFVWGELHANAWKFYRENVAKNKDLTYAVDEHYYMEPQWLYDNVDFYDEYPRDVYVFAGEYAGHDANLSNSVEAGVAEAAMMTGMERNGDLVKLASYAPLFNRIGHSHWTPDMIWFDEDSVVLTPSYYVQKMFSDYAGDYALELNGQEKILRDSKLYISLVKKGDETILKVANGDDKDQDISLVDINDNEIKCKATVVTMSALNGKAKVPVVTKAIAKDNNRAVAIDILSNKELCELRAPEPVSYSIEEKQIDGILNVKAKSVVTVVLN